jgi:hypothetical protein
MDKLDEVIQSAIAYKNFQAELHQFAKHCPHPDQQSIKVLERLKQRLIKSIHIYVGESPNGN